MQKDQSVSQMAQEVLMRQAKDLSQRSGHTLDDALQAVSDTEAGRQLEELANGAHRHEKASEWQAGLILMRRAQRGG